MLYTFKSPAAGNLIMLQPNGARVLQIIGKDPGPKGVVLPEQMPAAILALEAAITLEDTALQEARAKGEPIPEAQAVSLRQRAKPFIDMLRRCQQAGKNIVWGV